MARDDPDSKGKKLDRSKYKCCIICYIYLGPDKSFIRVEFARIGHQVDVIYNLQSQYGGPECNQTADKNRRRDSESSLDWCFDPEILQTRGYDDVNEAQERDFCQIYGALEDDINEEVHIGNSGSLLVKHQVGKTIT